MEHKKYEKIRALGNPENDGILEGTVYIQEKIDGANLSIWRDLDGLFVGSRTQVVGNSDNKEGFRGAVEYVNEHPSIYQLIVDLEVEYNTTDVRLFGEWLVKHTIGDYDISAYNHFYLFDIEINGEPLSTDIVNELANKYDINRPEIFEVIENPTRTLIDSYVGRSSIGPNGEGVLLKNPKFVNKWGNKVYAKVVGDKFKEENMITFGGMQKGDNEIKIVLKYCTDGRVRKIINKIEQNEDKDISLEDISKIIGMTQNDIITEEVWNYQKFGVIDFKRLKSLLGKRTAKIALSIINNEPVSVAFEDDINS